jgi:peptidoglycan-N-acetylglucosamine deacetylase
VWSVDVVSGDTAPGLTPEQLFHDTLERLRRMGKGVILFHDLKAVTAETLDSFLTTLKAEGFKIVHTVSNSAYKATPELVAKLDVEKTALQNVAFTGVATTGSTTPVSQGGGDTGEVDIMKTEFLQIEASALAAKQELADSNIAKAAAATTAAVKSVQQAPARRPVATRPAPQTP